MNLFTIKSGRTLPFFQIFFILNLLILPFKSFSQIPVDYDTESPVDPVAMVQQYLIGEGVETFNITYTGAPLSRGRFWGTSNIGIESGIILSSGKVSDSEGPNNTGSKTTQMGTAGDPTLSILAGGNASHDASILEFDFVPQSNTVEFRYVFSSEEWPEYANSNFNDVFGFFISGPGIYGNFPSPPNFPNGAINIALLPILAFPPLYVSINNINNGQNNNGPCENCSYYSHNTQNYIQYDASTVVLTARAVVSPCDTFHIKLSVSDIYDGMYDSGVFLEANSFSSVGLGANVAFTHAEVDTAVEGCNSASVMFKLFQITPVDYPIDLIIGGTAQNAVDYDSIPSQVIIPQGDSMFVLTINPIEDSYPEDLTETVTLIYNSSLCGVTMDTVTLYIKDLQPFSSYASYTPQTINCEDTLTLRASADGGQVPYYYNWSTGDILDSIVVSPPNPIQYTVQVSDICGQSETHTIDVNVIGPDAVACADIQLCLGNSTPISVEGGTSWLWTASPTDPTLTGQETLQSPIVSPIQTTTYTVVASDACGNEDSDEVSVFVGELTADAGADITICTDQSADLVAGPTGDLSYEWVDTSTGIVISSDPGVTVSPTVMTTYCVTVTDNACNGLFDQDCVTVDVIDMAVDAVADQYTVCAGTPVELTASNNPDSGTGTYQWYDDAGNLVNTGKIINVVPTVTTSYYCTITDGCEKNTLPVTITVNQLPLVSATSAANSICPDEYITINASGANTYFWTANPADPTLAGQETGASPSVSPTASTVYTLTGVDGNGCENTDQLSVTVKPRMYADFTSSVQTACEDESITFTYQGNGMTSANYQWDFNGDVRSGQGPHNVSWSTMGTKNITLVVTQDQCVSEPVTQSVEINPTPHADFNMGVSKGCVPLTVDFTNTSTNTTPDVTYHWDFGSAGTTTQSSPSQVFTNPGQYNVSLVVANPGCQDVMTIPVAVDAYPVPQAEFSANPMKISLKNPYITFTSNSTGDNLTYQWNTGDGTVYTEPTFTHTYADSGYFNVTLVAENEFGCLDTVAHTVTITPRFLIHVPTAFTPNNDGLNDKLRVTGNGVKKFSISIYNRWGNLIFESEDINVSWDGKINGKPALPGVYVYHTYFMDDNDEVSEQTGSFTLMK